MKTFKEFTSETKGRTGVLKYADGSREWYKDGKRHREDGPAGVYKNGEEIWYVNGQRHRLDGPAIIKGDGTAAWYKNDLLHREDGPAIINPNKKKTFWTNGSYGRVVIANEDEWWIDGKKLTPEQIERQKIKNNLSSDAKDVFGDIVDKI